MTNNTLSGPVDVLAAWANDTTCSLAEANQRATVYAAVAELIEAAVALEDAARCVQSGQWDASSIELERQRMRAALANVGGAK